ncbi:MAG: glycogen/starch/alpha-glucan phosphorylase [Rhodospirillales bacterium]
MDATPVDAGKDTDLPDLKSAIRNHLMYNCGETPRSASLADWRHAVSQAIRDRVVQTWMETARRIGAEGRKRVYYLSMEFLIGRLLEDAIVNLGLEDETRDALKSLGINYDTLVDDEPDAALGNGGLGRLAACFLDSMSTVGVAGIGYGIRYDHGLFKQTFRDGWQVEQPEDWLSQPHTWEFERRNAVYAIGFGGEVTPLNRDRALWKPAEVVLAAGYDTPIPGWRGRWVNTLRLWAAKPTTVFDLERFNHGDYLGAAAPEVLAQTISRVLYPNDTTEEGKVLRLKQEFFFTAASLRDLVARFLVEHGDLNKLPEKVAIQLNDTHPAIAGPELIRILVDEYGLGFGRAYRIARGCLHYTNHTLLPEALERWPVHLMNRLLPRHMQLIHRINEAHAADVQEQGRMRPGGVTAVDGSNVRMGDLAFMMARKVNGVSALHTDLMRQTVFKDLHELHPDRIVNQTNGVTPRRWLRSCNPGLAKLLTEASGNEDWVTDLDQLRGLGKLADDAEFKSHFLAAKRHNKELLAAYLQGKTGLTLDPDALFDIQIKRIHEYKRQLMNILETAALWNDIRDNPQGNWTPRVKIFGGKAAPGYFMAKLIIKFINDIGRTVNTDPLSRGKLTVVYPANYNVSMAERLIPAADLSEQISTAGMEASGTGNMKLAMNGALTIGTLDGANIEIKEQVGDDNIFIFGMTAEEVQKTRDNGFDSNAVIEDSPRLARVMAQLENGTFSPHEPERFRGIVDNLRHHDWFRVTADFDAYYEAQRRVEKAWADRDAWARSAVINTLQMGYFSSDRTIRGYAREVWEAEAGI